MDNYPIINPGKRLTIAGRTGSGKTQLGEWFVRRSPGFWIILDQKHDESLAKLGIKVYNEKDIYKWLKNPKSKFLIFRPKTTDADAIDEIIFNLSENVKNIGLFVDELMYLQKNGQTGKGLEGWLTRGRSRKQSFIGITQRPKRLSLFTFSEADYIVSMQLTLPDDRKRIFEFVGNPQVIENPEDFCWRFYDVSRDTLKEFGPVPVDSPAKP